MSESVKVPLDLISHFTNDARDILTTLLQECKKEIRKKLAYYTTPKLHGGFPIHPEYFLSLEKELGLDLNNLQEAGEQRINDLRKALENQKRALKNLATQLSSMVGIGLPLIANDYEATSDQDSLLAQNQALQKKLDQMNQENAQLKEVNEIMLQTNGQLSKGLETMKLANEQLNEKSKEFDQESERLKDIIINFSFSLLTANYYKGKVREQFIKNENFTKYIPPPIQGFNMLERRPINYDESDRPEKPFNVSQYLIQKILETRDLEGKMSLSNQKYEEVLQQFEAEKLKLRNTTVDKNRLEQTILEMENMIENERRNARETAENARNNSMRTLSLAGVANVVLSLCLFGIRC